MNKKHPFYLYLLDKISEDSAKCYLSYLRNCDSEKLSVLPSGETLLSILEMKCGAAISDNEKFDVVQHYISEVSKEISNLHSTQSKFKKDLRNVRSALRSYSEYVVSTNTVRSVAPQQKDKKQNFIKRDVEQIDGMSMLTDIFPDIKHFIEFVLSGCYFFSAEDMHKQFNDLNHNIENRIAIPARHSKNSRLFNKEISRGTKGVIFNDRMFSGDILVDIDGNGNAAIDKLFIQKTRRHLKGDGKRQPDFLNLKISHIWGNAFDPRYFTSLWNIILVPSFANDILDKPSSQNGSYHLGACLLNTIKRILYKFYGLDSIDWGKLRLTPPSYISDKVISGKYTINVFDCIDDSNEGIPEIQTVEIMI